MIIDNVSLGAGLASLAICLATGIWIGRRLAIESHRIDMAIAQALRDIDTTPEDEMAARLSSGPDPDWREQVDKWIASMDTGCPCGKSHSEWKK